MVTLLLDGTQLEVALSRSERALSFRRQSILVPRESIVKVQLTEDAWTWLRGVPDPGVNLPVAVAMGSWKSAGGRDFVVIRRRQPSVVIDLDGSGEFQRLVLTTRHGAELARSLHLSTADVASSDDATSDDATGSSGDTTPGDVTASDDADGA